MKHLVLYIGVLLFVASCGQADKKRSGTAVQDSISITVPDTIQSKKKTLSKYISDKYSLRWETHHADTTDYMCELSLDKEYLVYWFHMQCIYYYFTYKTSDSTIDMLWSYKEDCMLRTDFLKSSHGIKKYPKAGDVFATFTLTSDTTLEVKYYFPQWVKKVNEITKDSIFPATYYLKKE